MSRVKLPSDACSVLFTMNDGIRTTEQQIVPRLMLNDCSWQDEEHQPQEEEESKEEAVTKDMSDCVSKF